MSKVCVDSQEQEVVDSDGNIVTIQGDPSMRNPGKFGGTFPGVDPFNVQDGVEDASVRHNYRHRHRRDNSAVAVENRRIASELTLAQANAFRRIQEILNSTPMDGSPTIANLAGYVKLATVQDNPPVVDKSFTGDYTETVDGSFTGDYNKP